MTKDDFLKLMHFPSQWTDLGMYPDELFKIQVGGYKPGHERGSEHSRNGAFHWWLSRNPSKETLKSLVQLTYLDPDAPMGADVRRYIAMATNCDREVLRLLGSTPTPG